MEFGHKSSGSRLGANSRGPLQIECLWMRVLVPAARRRSIMWLTLLALAGSLLCCATLDSDFVGFYLYTRSNPARPDRLFVDDVRSVRVSHFDARRPTKIIIHGWMDSFLGTANQKVRAAYQERGNYNLISLDWWSLAAMSYMDAQPLAPWVGQQCALFVRFMALEGGLRPEELVLIGHSMGAHVAGFCGWQLQQITGGEMRVGYIVALDPALPLYWFVEPPRRLGVIDAHYVMALHTNGLIKGHLMPLGHADFYANGGQHQPGCGFDLNGTCSHARVVDLYAEAVRQKTSFAPYGLCRTYAQMILCLGVCPLLPEDQVRLGDPLEVGPMAGLITFNTSPEAPFGRPKGLKGG